MSTPSLRGLCVALVAITSVACGAASPPVSAPEAPVLDARIGAACDTEHPCGDGASCLDVAAMAGMLEDADEVLRSWGEEDGEPTPPRASYCDLPPARRALPPDEGMLAFGADGLAHAVLGRIALEEIAGESAPRALGHVESTLVIGRLASAAEAGGWTGRTLRLADAGGTSCDAVVGAPWLVQRVRDGWYDDAPDDEPTDHDWDSDALLATLAAPVGACAQPIFARAAELTPVEVVAAEVHVTPELTTRALAAFRALVPVQLIAQSAARELAPEDGPWWRERGPLVSRFVVGGVGRVVVAAWGGDRCEGFSASITVVLRERAGSEPSFVVESIASRRGYFHHALDVDGDGRIELIGSPAPDAPYDELFLLSPTLDAAAVTVTSEPC